MRRRSSHDSHGIFEDPQTASDGWPWSLAGPRGVLKGFYISLGMRHEPQDQAGGIADTGDIVDTAIRIGLVGVEQRDLPVVPHGPADIFSGGDELSLAVGNGQIHRFDPLGPDAFARPGWWSKMNPAIDKSAAVVVGEGRGLTGLAGERAGQDIGLDKDLKPVADADHRFARCHEISKHVTEMIGDLIGQNSAGGDVVAVTEAAGEGEYLKIMHLFWIFQQAIDVNKFWCSAGTRKSVRCFGVAIGAGGTKDKNPGSHDAIVMENAMFGSSTHVSVRRA